jgi:hypothetical protein
MPHATLEFWMTWRVLLFGLCGVGGSAFASGSFAESHWGVETEVGLPISVELAAEDLSFRVTALQVRARLACDVRMEKKSKREVACEIVDIGLMGATPGGAKILAVEETLAKLDAGLTGATVVFSSTPERPILEPTLEVAQGKGLYAETLQYISERLVAGFDLGSPALDADHWRQKNSRLMELPAGVKAGGRAKVEHTVVERGQQIAVSTRGDGSFDIAPHFFFSDPLATESKRRGLNEASASPRGGAPEVSGTLQVSTVTRSLDLHPGLGVEGGLRDGAALPTDEVPPHAIFETQMVAESVFTLDGALEERVWALSAKPTASSVTTARGWTAGRVERLAADDEFSVGDTHPTAPPGTIGRSRLESWVPL